MWLIITPRSHSLHNNKKRLCIFARKAALLVILFNFKILPLRVFVCSRKKRYDQGNYYLGFWSITANHCINNSTVSLQNAQRFPLNTRWLYFKFRHLHQSVTYTGDSWEGSHNLPKKKIRFIVCSWVWLVSKHQRLLACRHENHIAWWHRKNLSEAFGLSLLAVEFGVK